MAKPKYQPPKYTIGEVVVFLYRYLFDNKENDYRQGVVVGAVKPLSKKEWTYQIEITNVMSGQKAVTSQIEEKNILHVQEFDE